MRRKRLVAISISITLSNCNVIPPTTSNENLFHPTTLPRKMMENFHPVQPESKNGIAREILTRIELHLDLRVPDKR